MPAVDPNSPEGHKIDVAEAKALIKAVSEAGDPCDRAFHFTNAAIAASNMQYLYHNAEAGAEQCQRSAEAVGDLQIPPHATDDVQSKMKDALNDLFQVYSSERGLMDRLKGFANNGNARPSDIENYQQDFDRTQSLKLGSAAELAQAIQSEGAVPEPATSKHHRHHKAG